jgi:ferric-dicitrate binding protein FerR (iron transport regulator)
MSTAFAPIDAATITSLNKGEEAALERIFRTHYDVLLERALERLKDEKLAAPRLVAAVTRELWEEREGFHSSAEIEGFLNEELRHRARAVRSRMAAVHRFEKTEGVKAPEGHAAPTADQLWAEIAKAMHQPIADPAAVAKRRREHVAHEAAGHIAGVAKPRNWKTPALLIAVGAIALWGGYVWAARTSKASVITQMLAASDAPQVTTRPGQLATFALPDSSIVRLAAESRLVRVANIGREYRTAMVTGSAAITVGSASALPFEMRLGEASITATAGEFAVRDFANESMRFVQARSDGIVVRLPSGERTLKSGETLALGRDSTMTDATAEQAAMAFGWLDGKLILRTATVRDALAALYRWYGLDISIRDSTLYDRTVSLDVPIESSQAAIAAVESGAQLKFEWVDTRMTFKDAGARR